MKISRRPVSISIDRIHLPPSSTRANVASEPADSPVLLTHEKDEKNASLTDNPMADSAMPPIIITRTYRPVSYTHLTLPTT